MERIVMIQKALDYIEAHLLQIEDPNEIAGGIHVPGSDLQTGFSVIVGYSLSEYIRNRRLYEASKDLLSLDAKVIDITYKYGYESPDSFSKAFYKFHGVLPSKINPENIGRVFRPITVDLSINGGLRTNYRIVQQYAFSIIGLSLHPDEKNIRTIWDSFIRKYKSVINHERVPQNDSECSIAENNIGEYGIYDYSKKMYMIAGRYFGGNITEKLTLHRFEPSSWAVLELHGSISRNTIDRMEKEMIEDISGSTEYRIKNTVVLENYGPFIPSSPDDFGHCVIQIPVEHTKSKQGNTLFKIANIISILILVFALAVGGYEYHVKSDRQIDTEVLYNLAQYAGNAKETERR